MDSHLWRRARPYDVKIEINLMKKLLKGFVQTLTCLVNDRGLT
jgi:hypothetical protein